MRIKVRALLDTLDLSRVIGDRRELKKVGREYTGLCPFHDDHTPSFTVVPHKQFAHCFACGWNGNALDFLMQYEGLTFKQAARRLMSEYGATPSIIEANGADHPLPPQRESKKRAEGDLYHSEVPPPKTPRPAMRTRLGPPVKVWEYKTAAGQVQGYVARYQDAARKVILCWSWGQDFPEGATTHSPSWHCRHFTRPRPLYGLELLAQSDPETTVILVEGEKTADAARQLFPASLAIVMTWPGGCPGIRHADFRPLADRHVILVPDHDDAGRKAMAWMADQSGKTDRLDVFVPKFQTLRVRLPEDSRPAGWDLADASFTPEEALQWLQAGLKPWSASPLREFIGDPEEVSAPIPDRNPPLREGDDAPSFDPLPIHAYDRDIEQLAEAPAYSKPAGNPLDWEYLFEHKPPDRDWAIDSWLGMGHVTLLAGPGGTGKSLLAQTIATALAVGTNYVGTIQKARRVLYWSCEDDHDELWRRQIAICDYLRTRLVDLKNLLVIPRLGQRNDLMLVTHDGWSFTSVMEELEKIVVENKIEVLFLDTVAQACPNEIDRHIVTTFCNKFAGLTPGLATVLIAHPSRTLGAEFSGSTAWEAAVRMRWLFANKLPDTQIAGEPDEEAPDDEIRFLAKRKANYTNKDWVKLRYERGIFVPEYVTDQGYVSATMRSVAESIVMKAMEDFAGMNIVTTDSGNSPSFLPKMILEHHMAQNATRKHLTEAMRDLMRRHVIVRTTAGKYDNRKDRIGLIIAPPPGAADKSLL
jgi:hypothetical protein